MIVAFTVSCLRQKYLRETLRSWAKVRGVQDAVLVFALEPPEQVFPLADFTQAVQRAFPGAQVHASRQHLQCLKNTHRALELAFASPGTDFAVVAEEDLEVADDTLEYLAWARDAYAGDENVLAVCAHARGSLLDDPAAAARAPWFSPLVWGTWRDRWEHVISPNWKPGVGTGNPQSWDVNIQLLVRDGGYACVFPARSRVLHRGQASTQTAYPLSEYLYGRSVSECYAPHYGPQDYREIEFPAQPGVLVV